MNSTDKAAEVRRLAENFAHAVAYLPDDCEAEARAALHDAIEALATPTPAPEPSQGQAPGEAAESDDRAFKDFAAWNDHESIAAAQQPAATSEPLYLVMAGGDGFTSAIVPESKLDDAYILTQWIDLESVTPDDRAEALEHFHDDDEWTHTGASGGGERLKFTINFEDGWVTVIRLFDTSALTQQPAATSDPHWSLRTRFADLLHLLEFANIDTPTRSDAPKALTLMAELRAALAHQPAASALEDGKQPAATSEPKDVTLPDGTVRHNVGSDNLSDEDRSAMRAEEERREAPWIGADGETYLSHEHELQVAEELAFRQGQAIAGRLAASQEGDKLDAERYRQVRRGQKWSVIDWKGDDLRAEALDAAIDAARDGGAK
jgi:hypothetical protein